MGANKHRGEVELKAGDKTYVLRYTTNSLVRLEDELGKPAMELGESFHEARALFWAGLLHAHPDLTMEQAGEIMDEVGFTEAVLKATEALKLAFPGAVKAKQVDQGKQPEVSEATTTGERSA
ncbi:MAG TPA: hypothetical protein VIK75_08050 [Calditerricola sp.]